MVEFFKRRKEEELVPRVQADTHNRDSQVSKKEAGALMSSSLTGSDDPAHLPPDSRAQDGRRWAASRGHWRESLSPLLGALGLTNSMGHKSRTLRMKTGRASRPCKIPKASNFKFSFIRNKRETAE